MTQQNSRRRIFPRAVFEQRLRFVLDVVNRYLAPDGISIKKAMSEIIGLVDPWPSSDFPASEKEPVCWLLEATDGYKGVTFVDPATGEGAYDGFTATPLVRANSLPAINVELLEALKEMMELERRGRFMPIGREWDKARAAIEKATKA